MIDFLEYVLHEFNKANCSLLKKRIVIKEVERYKDLWMKYQHDNSFMCPYTETPFHVYTRNLEIGPNKINVEISWDIYGLQNSLENQKIKYLELSNFQQLINEDLITNEVEYNNARRKVQSVQEHSIKELLLLDFIPAQATYLIDGKHRYTEYLKFKQKESIPVKGLNNLQAKKFIYKKRDYVAHAIITNVFFLNEYLNGNNRILKHLIKI